VVFPARLLTISSKAAMWFTLILLDLDSPTTFRAVG
jgi:hypothetical protein